MTLVWNASDRHKQRGSSRLGAGADHRVPGLRGIENRNPGFLNPFLVSAGAGINKLILQFDPTKSGVAIHHSVYRSASALPET